VSARCPPVDYPRSPVTHQLHLSPRRPSAPGPVFSSSLTARFAPLNTSPVPSGKPRSPLGVRRGPGHGAPRPRRPPEPRGRPSCFPPPPPGGAPWSAGLHRPRVEACSLFPAPVFFPSRPGRCRLKRRGVRRAVPSHTTRGGRSPSPAESIPGRGRGRIACRRPGAPPCPDQQRLARCIFRLKPGRRLWSNGGCAEEGCRPDIARFLILALHDAPDGESASLKRPEARFSRTARRLNRGPCWGADRRGESAP